MSTATEIRDAAPDEPVEVEHPVTPLELFFDLVFVLAFTQVTAAMAEDPTWGGLARGMLVLATVWWAWVGYAWLTNAIDPEEGWPRLLMFVAMAAMLVVALAVPDAFGESGLAFALAYLVVRAIHIVLTSLAPGDPGVRRQALLGLGPTALAGTLLLVIASQLDGIAQGACWALALAVDFSGALRGVERWQVHAEHFAERHGLILIVALGESIVALGVGAAGLPIDAGLVAASALGVAVAAALWWAYFDVVALVAARVLLAQSTRRARNTMARDSFSYLHLVLIAGIVLLALGVKKVLGHVDEPLGLIPAVALCGGPALYLVGLVALRLRNVGSVNRQRVVALLVLVALIPAATTVDALLGLTAVAVVCVGLVAYEAMRFASNRDRVRHLGEASAAVSRPTRR